MKRSNKMLSLFGLLTVIALLVTACGTPPATTEAPAATQPPAPTAAPPTVAPTDVPTEAPTAVPVVEIKIAFMGPLTGGAAFLGTEQLAFARLAVEHFNSEMSGHYNATLLEEDTDITPDKAVPVAERLIADATVLGVVGPAGSGQVEATAPLFNAANLVHVSASATRPTLGKGADGNRTFNSFFRVVPNDDVQGPTDGNFIADVLGAKTVYVIDEQSSYGVALADIVQATLDAKGVTTDRASVTQNDTDFSALVTTIKGFKPDVVFMAGQVPSQGALLARQLQEQGVEAPVFGGDGFFSQKDYIDDAGGSTEGAYASVFAPDIHGVDEAADLVAAADEAFPTWGSFGPPTYVATLVVLEAAVRASEAGNMTREGVLAEVGNTDMASSILGVPVAFDEFGEVTGAQFFISQVVDGKFKQVFP
ncbi:MAG: branched-chain amino acid ABC transporter substrate-binding protein [Chloroflexi bacterium]|nr:branched-chain amino acid ABC transporter substrate-binding protein [Chloroflexota bacterium]